MDKYARDNQQEFEEKVIQVSRVSKKTKGGDQMSFSALMIVGDRKGKVGVGLGKAKGVAEAIRKGVRKAKKKMMPVPIDGTTIPFRAEGRYGAGHVLLKPASPGSGVIAGGSVRAIMEAGGIKDVSAKILGSDNQSSSVYATLEAFKKINKIVKVRNITLRKEKPVQTQSHPEKNQSNLGSQNANKAQGKSNKSPKKTDIKKPVKKETKTTVEKKVPKKETKTTVEKKAPKKETKAKKTAEKKSVKKVTKKSTPVKKK
jgi:small subunit ribosomal protein S5